MRRTIVFLLLINCILLSGCKSEAPPCAPTASADSIQGTRDSTPHVLTPSADGILTFENDVVTIDISHTDLGYCMVNYKGNAAKAKMQLSTPDSTTYTYTLHGGFETFPLTGNDGTYRITIFENVHDDQYSTALTEEFNVRQTDEFNVYLYPNQYVNFAADCETVKKGAELASCADTDLDVVSNVYNYVAGNITYDKEKAETVESGYLPCVDEILSSGKGICFDYAAVMATMLRSQGIPTRLEVGYAKDAYHAWISVYLTDVGWVNGIIEFDGKHWELMDPTFAASQSEKKLKKFIGDGSNYITKYVY